ncbi:hypothetical protein ACOMHN_018003 [Nucella lapillus]
MIASFQLENETTFVDLKVRRVLIFAPGASFTMAGSKPVSVFSRFRELEIGIHYNGYGKVSDTANGSVIFKGQLNATVFEGQIIYQSLNRSHTVQCLHNNSLEPDFYQSDDCLACIFTTYDTHHNPDFPVGWRSGGHSPCHKSFSNHRNQDTFGTETANGVDRSGEYSFDFPQTGFSEYRSRTDKKSARVRASGPAPFTSETPQTDSISTPLAVTQNKTAHRTSAAELFDNGETSHDSSNTEKVKKTRASQGKDFISAVNNPTGLREAKSNQFSEAKQFKRSKGSVLGDGASSKEGQTMTAPALETKPQNPERPETDLSFQNFVKPAGNRNTTESSAKTLRVTSPLGKDYRTTSFSAITSSRPAHPKNDAPHDRDMQRNANNKQIKIEPFSEASHSGGQPTPKFLTDSPRPRPGDMPFRRRNRRDRTGAQRSKRKKTRSSRPQPTPSAQRQSYTETISCPLHLVADHLFFSEIGEKSPAKTVNLMLNVVIGADAVFRGTDFDGDGQRDNIGFMVKNITIIHNSSVAFYHYSRSNGNSFNYLKSFSTGDFSDVCLGVAFTAIDFQRGVVGLAWYASSLGGGAGKGGICGQRVYLPNEGSSFSFNTAIVSFLNHGTSLSMEKAILTLAHELGHCFGSSHDDMAGKWTAGGASSQGGQG